MSRTLRILRRLLVLTGLLAAAVLALWIFVAPRFVEARIRGALAGAGLADARLHVRGLTLAGADLVGVALDGSGRATADLVSVAYDPGSLLAGRVRTITITGLSLDLRLEDGRLDLGPLSAFEKSGSAAAPGRLPFDEIVLRAATIRIGRDGESWTLPLDGTLRPKSGGIEIAARSRFLSFAADLTAHLDPETGIARGRIAVAGPDGERLAVEVASRGPASAGNLKLAIDASAPRLDRVVAGHRIAAARASLSGRVDLGGFTRLTDVGLELKADRLGVDGEAVATPRVTLDSRAGDLRLTATGARAGLAFSATATLAAPDLATLADAEVSTRVTLSGKGAPPPELLDLLRTRGLRVAGSPFFSLDATADLNRAGGEWTVAVPTAHLGLRATRIGLPVRGAALADVRADLTASATLAHGALTGEAAPGSTASFSPVLRGVLTEGHPRITARTEAPLRFSLTASGDYSASGAAVRVGIEEFAFRDDDLAVGGASATVDVEVHAAREGLFLTAAKGATVRAGFDAGPVRSGRAVAVLEAPAVLELPAGGPARLRVPRLCLELGSPAPVRVGETAAVEGLAASLAVEIEGDGTAFSARLAPESRVSAVHLRAGGEDLSGLALSPDDSDAPRIEFDPAGGISIRGAVRSTGALGLDGPAADGRIRAVGLSGGVELGADGSFGAAGLLHADVERARWKSAGVEIRDAEIDLPLGGGGEAGLARIVRKGFLRAKSMTWRGRELPPPAIDLAREGTAMVFRVDWPITDAARLTGEGNLRLAGGRPVGGARVAVPRFELAPDGRIATALEDATGFAFTGESEMTGSIRIGPDRVEPRLELRFFDATATSADGSRSIRGLAGAVTIESFSPLSTPGAQQLSFSEAKLGDLLIEDGTVKFRVESPRSILVERAEWRLGETGKFWVYSFRLDPERPNVDVELFTEELSLADWLSLVTMDYASGEGKLYGRIALEVRTEPKLSVTIGEGFLHAEETGSIRIRDTEKIREVLDRSIPEMEGDIDYTGVVKDRIVGALENFEFTSLRFDIVHRDGGMSLRTHIEGKGKAEPHQELELNVNLNGFEELIGPALAVKLGIDKAKAGMLDRLKATWK